MGHNRLRIAPVENSDFGWAADPVPYTPPLNRATGQRSRDAQNEKELGDRNLQSRPELPE